MTKVDLEIHEDVISIINKIKNINDDGIELEIPAGSVLFDNIINLKVLEKEADKMGKTVHFRTLDEAGINLISSMREEDIYEPTLQEETTIAQNTVNLVDTVPQMPRSAKKLRLIFSAFPALNLAFLKRAGLKFPLAIAILVGMLLYGGYTFAVRAPKAQIKIIVTSQPLTRSVSVKVKKDTNTNAEQKILRGFNVEAPVTETASAETTGEKMVGEKAKGKIKIYNKTDAEKTFKEGTKIMYEDKDLNFYLDDDVTVAASVITDPLDPTKVKWGEATGNVTAENIGDAYNIDKGEALEIDDYKTSQFVASSTDDFSGGTSKKVKIVTEDDIKNLSAKTLQTGIEKGQKALTEKLGLRQKLIAGSTTNQITKETFNAKIDDETDKLELTQTINTTGLVYSAEELDSVLDELAKGFVPDGFVISSKERDVNVEILGNSDTTVLNSTEADIQVTLKTYVVPDVQEDKLKDELKGKGLSEAQKILGGIRNVKTYELNIDPKIPLLTRMPSNTENISVEVVRNDD